MVDSPLAAIAYANATSDQQLYRLYFQTAHGNIKESKYNGTAWQDAL